MCQRIECPNCKGKGYETCYRCNGLGFYSYTNDDGEQAVEICVRCDGKGTIECTRCWGRGTIIDTF